MEVYQSTVVCGYNNDESVTQYTHASSHFVSGVTTQISSELGRFFVFGGTSASGAPFSITIHISKVTHR